MQSESFCLIAMQYICAISDVFFFLAPFKHLNKYNISLSLKYLFFVFLKGSWSRNFKKGSKPLDSLEPQGFYNLALLLVISLENAVFVDFW